MQVTNGAAKGQSEQATTAAGRGGRGKPTVEMRTRPEHIVDKSGATGSRINVVSNYIVLSNRPNTAMYQYHVKYEPHLEFKKLRIGLLYSQEAVIGGIRAFDGMILYLPFRLKDEVTTLQVKTRRDEDVKIIITLTNELSASNPVCLQLFNIVFRRY